MKKQHKNLLLGVAVLVLGYFAYVLYQKRRENFEPTVTSTIEEALKTGSLDGVMNKLKEKYENKDEEEFQGSCGLN